MSEQLEHLVRPLLEPRERGASEDLKVDQVKRDA